MEALKRQIEMNVSKGKEPVILIVMGPTLTGDLASGPASSNSHGGLASISMQDPDTSRVATVDQRGCTNGS